MTKAIELSQLGNVLTVAEGTGNVGIRESSPSYEFHVKGAGTVAYFEGTGGNSFIGLEDSDDGSIGFIGVDGGSLKFQTSGGTYSDKFTISSGGTKQIINGNLNIYQTYIDFSGDQSTTPQTAVALYRPADGTFAISTQNAERLRITSTGKVCINNDNALSDLHVCTAASSEQDGTFRIGGSVASLGLVLDYDQDLATVSRITANPSYTNNTSLLKICVDGDANANQLVLTGAGKIGIGTDNPQAQFDMLHGAIRLSRTASYTSHVEFGITHASSSDYGSLYFDNTNATGAYVFRTTSSNTERLRIAADGDLEYRYNDADTSTQIGSTQVPHGLRIYNTNNTTGRLSGISFSHGGAGTANVGIFHEQLNTATSSGSCLADLVFYTKNSGVSNMTEKVRITSDGKIGVNNTSTPVIFSIHDSNGSDCKLLLTSTWTGTQQILFGGGSTTSTGTNGSTAGIIKVQASAPSGAATGSMHFFYNSGDSLKEGLRITPEGHKWTSNGSIFHGSPDITNFTDAGRNGDNNVSIRAGDPQAGATPTNGSSAIKIYPAGARSATEGNLTGGIAWQHLDPNYSSWDTSFGAGAQIWMGAALHDTPGQERDRFNLWMNSQTTQNSQPNNLAIEVYPNGNVRHPKLPCFMVRNSTSSSAFSANSKATWDTIDLNNGSHFDNTNDRFICPINGFYFFSCQMLSNNDTRLFHELRKNGTRIDGTRTESYQGDQYQTNTFVAVVQASANDWFEVWLGSQNGYGSVYANFNGHLIG